MSGSSESSRPARPARDAGGVNSVKSPCSSCRSLLKLQDHRASSDSILSALAFVVWRIYLSLVCFGSGAFFAFPLVDLPGRPRSSSRIVTAMLLYTSIIIFAFI